MPIRFAHLFILAALAWLAPLLALPLNAVAGEPSALSHRTVLDVARTADGSTELPSLIEEERPEEERLAEIDRQPVSAALVTAPAVSSWSSAPPAATSIPINPRFASLATPRGPPVRS